MSIDLHTPSDIGDMALRWDMAITETPKGQGVPLIESIGDIPSIRSFADQKIEFLVEGVIAAGTVTLLSGESGSGKTTVVTAISHAVAGGVPFAGLLTQMRPVLYLDRENPLAVVVERFDRLGINDGPNFYYWGGWLSDEPPVPSDPRVSNWVTNCEPKPLVIVDSLIAFHGGDENDARETRAFMQGFRRLADLGATVIALHHSGKAESAKEYRGSSDIKASIDVGYCLANLGDSSQLGALRLKAFKARFSVLPEVILQYRAGRFEIDGRGPVQTVSESLRDLLVANPGIQAQRFQDLARDKGLGRDRARTFLDNGVHAGTVGKDRGSHNALLFTWNGRDNTPDEVLF